MDEERQGVKQTGPGKLNLDAPLLSTKRPTGLTIKICRMDSFRDSVDSSDRVPFSWEHTPGRPKNLIRNHDSSDQDIALKPLPKPPPIRWYHPRDSSCFEAHHHDDYDGSHGGTLTNHHRVYDDDGGADDEYDDDEKDEEVLSFSDAIDLFTLAETLTNTDAGGGGRVHDSFEGRNVDADGGGNEGWLSIMMERFLPDAAALAASSSLCLDAKDLEEEEHNHLGGSIYSCDSSSSSPSSYTRGGREGGCPRRRDHHGRAFTSWKGGCGLDMFFPWRAKHKFCGVKSPVRIGCYDWKPGSKGS